MHDLSDNWMNNCMGGFADDSMGGWMTVWVVGWRLYV